MKTARQCLDDKDYMRKLHEGHVKFWEDRVATGELNGPHLDNAHDLIRIHRIHATMPAEPAQSDLWQES